MVKKRLPILIILLLALLLRAALLTDLPPGLTHDEANHGREAIGILNGVFLFYFPLNYGSEPLYSYTAAATMWAVGPRLFALRLVNVLFGVLTIAAAYAWARRTLDRRVALLTAVLLALSFWPLASSRQALRAGMLPFFTLGAVWFFWRFAQPQAKTAVATGQKHVANIHANLQQKRPWPAALAFGFCVAVTLHIYLAARVAWILFPLFLLYLALFHRTAFRRAWRPTLAGLGLAGLLALPMFLYLQRNPYALTRLDMLNRPLQDLSSGNLLPVLQSAAAALLAFIWPGFGDRFLAYNIPGRPVLDAVTAVFFILGVALCLRRWRQPAYAFVLLWFAAGIIPSLLTGPTANTTRNLAALPAVFMLPAIGFAGFAAGVQRHLRPNSGRILVYALAAAWLTFAGSLTVRDYFVRWGQAPEVRDAYQHTLTVALAHLQQKTVSDPLLLSSVYPGPAHDPSISLVLTAADPLPAERWVDARFALALPRGAAAHAVIPAATPPHPAFAPLLTPLETVSLRPDDLNPFFTSYTLNARDAWWSDDAPMANYGNAVELIHAEWLQPRVTPGETAELLTIWRVTDPARVGPIVPPAFTTDVALFTHVLRPDGEILTQQDALHAPSWDWQPGDVILQIHPLAVPAQAAAGAYPAVVGIYDRQSGARLPVLNTAGEVVDTVTAVAPLEVAEP